MATTEIEPEIIRCPSHTRAAFHIETFPLIVHWAADLCRELRADAIAACGHSGLSVAGAVAYVTRLPVFAVRKKGEPTVAGSDPVSAVAPHGPAKKWVWLDDCMCSGGTFANAVRELHEANVIATARPVALLLYDNYASSYSKTYDLTEFSKMKELVRELPGLAKPIPKYGYRR